MEEIEIIIAKLHQIQNVIGYGGLFVVIILFISGILFYKYLIKSAERIAETASEKSISKYQLTLSKKIEKELRLFFRDEIIRSELNSHFAKKSIEIKLKVWQKTYQLYFDYQQIWYFDKNTINEKIAPLDKKFQENRKLIFINSVYLGGFITSKLITMNVGMRNYLHGKKMMFNYSEGSTGRNKVEQEIYQYANKVDETRNQVEDWINKNLLVDHDSNMWEFTESQLNIIKEQNQEEFRKLDSTKEK